MPIPSTRPDVATNGGAHGTLHAPGPPPPRRWWRRLPSVRTAIIALVVLLAAGLAVGPRLKSWLAAPPPPGLLVASGRIEGRVTTLTPKSSAWVNALHVDEGEAVKAGQVLATLDDQAQRERLRAAEAHVNALIDRLRAADSQLDMTERQVTLLVEQSSTSRQEAEIRLQRARFQAEQARREGERADMLVARELIAPQEAERARLASRVADHLEREAQAALATADKLLALAHLGERRLAIMRAERAALEREQQQARAQLDEQRSHVADFTIRSPIDGRVLTRTVERGERVGDGTPLFTLVDLDRLYVKIYVPEPSIGKVALGQEARVWVDAYPGRPFAARVSRVSQEAEFTPKNVETREERVKLVFAVEIALAENPDGVLKPGMPADAAIRWQPDVAWPARP